MASLVEHLKTFFLAQGLDKTYWIGYSGGLDSHVLLHLCAEVKKSYSLRLKAVHVHHGLSPHASDWVVHCEKICADLQIDLIQKSIQAKALPGDSPEETARDLRYAVFSDLMAPQDILLTAHQQDDQAETLLVQLFRGSGPKGLAAMPAMKAFAQGFHGRPLLSASRSELKKYAEEHRLTWIDDESNEDKSYARNFLRHAVLPVLKQRWPTVTKTLARVAENCAETEEMISSLVSQDLAACCGSTPRVLAINQLLLLNHVRQRQVLRTWILAQGFTVPSSAKLHQIQHDFLQAKQDKSPYMKWGNTELRRYQNEIYIMNALLPHDSMQTFSWDMTQSLILPHLGELFVTLTDSPGLSQAITHATVRFRQGGERCYFSERGCHQLLKHLMQEWNIPPWERDRVPLLFVEEELIAVVGFFIDSRYQSMPGQRIAFWAENRHDLLL